MNLIHEQIEVLKTQIKDLQLRHRLFEREYDTIWNKIHALEALEAENRKITNTQQIDENISVKAEEIITKTFSEDSDNPEINVISEKVINHSEKVIIPSNSKASSKNFTVAENKKSSNIQKDLEKFIGENIISKIGIIITILGVGIGAKYSIEHQLISPLTRIIIGYFLGVGLLVFGIYLKKNYEKFSAVLVSGAIAINYFLTYASFSFYHLVPKEFAFFLMFILTIFTVVASINYNNQLIAHIGFVGAYAVPFLLSDGNGEIIYLFLYMI